MASKYEKPATPAQGKKRLLALADHLEKVPRKRFDYSMWSSDNFDVKRGTCGTVGCAMGHACDVPMLRKLGLRISMSFNEVPEPCVGRTGAFYRCDYLFAISEVEYNYLFASIEGLRPKPLDLRVATPKQVAHKIRRFVKNEWDKWSRKSASREACSARRRRYDC